ncbi:MAG: class II aldolase/adducin family protein [Candidatus Margulisbacteria bacterium]|nr:class II aldolase/adducin family protein [Candidatus Margulisiibacteriota bacterium]
MTYQGVKFKVVFNNKKAPEDPRINELIKWCQTFNLKSLAPAYEGGSFGNLSFRLKENSNEFIISASRVVFGQNLCNDCFIKVTGCDLKQGIIYAEGLREPSSESMLHYAIYQKRPDINAIFHGHSKEILAKAEQLNLPQTKKEEPYGTVELVNSVLEIIDKHNFIIMKNHGFISLGKTMKEAGRISLDSRN